MNEPYFDMPDELDLRLDDRPGPARPISAAAAESLVQGALSGSSGIVVPLRPPARRATWSRVAVAAAVLFGFGASASAAVYWVRKSHQQHTPAPHSQAPAQTLAKPTTSPAAMPADSAPAPLVDVQALPPKTGKPVRHVALPKAAAERAARDQLAEANALRTHGAYVEAAARYAEAAATAPDSLTAHAAHVARGDLALAILERPADAIFAYRAALRAHANGPLAPEAWYGLSRAYRATGDDLREREALETLYKLAPATTAGRAARARLEAFEHRP